MIWSALGGFAILCLPIGHEDVDDAIVRHLDKMNCKQAIFVIFTYGPISWLLTLVFFVLPAIVIIPFNIIMDKLK